MPQNIDDSAATFDDPIQAPIDGEPGNRASFALAPSGLANRTRNLKNRIDAKDEYVQTTVGVNALSVGEKASLVHDHQNGGGGIISANELQLPSAGVWLFAVTLPGVFTNDPSDEEGFFVTVAPSNQYILRAQGMAQMSTIFVAPVSDPAVNKIFITSLGAGDLTLTDTDSGTLVAVRLY